MVDQVDFYSTVYIVGEIWYFFFIRSGTITSFMFPLLTARIFFKPHMDRTHPQRNRVISLNAIRGNLGRFPLMALNFLLLLNMSWKIVLLFMPILLRFRRQ
jgi:hypothetical protein